MRVLLDTNVFVAALLRSASCRALLEAVRDGSISLVTADVLVAELVDVLARPKFSARISEEDRRELLALIRSQGEFVTPRSSPASVRDPEDRPVLSCAYAAEVLVSGDHDLQVLTRVGSTPVLSPAALLERLKRR